MFGCSSCPRFFVSTRACYSVRTRVQVEAAEGEDFLRMTRSSGLEHVRKDAPEENYTFSPLYFGKKDKADVEGERDAFLPTSSSLWSWRDSGGEGRGEENDG